MLVGRAGSCADRALPACPADARAGIAAAAFAELVDLALHVVVRELPPGNGEASVEAEPLGHVGFARRQQDRKQSPGRPSACLFYWMTGCSSGVRGGVPSGLHMDRGKCLDIIAVLNYNDSNYDEDTVLAKKRTWNPVQTHAAEARDPGIFGR